MLSWDALGLLSHRNEVAHRLVDVRSCKSRLGHKLATASAHPKLPSAGTVTEGWKFLFGSGCKPNFTWAARTLVHPTIKVSSPEPCREPALSGSEQLRPCDQASKGLEGAAQRGFLLMCHAFVSESSVHARNLRRCPDRQSLLLYVSMSQGSS